MNDEDNRKDEFNLSSNNWGTPENPSKFSGWNAGLCAPIAMVAILGALALSGQGKAAAGIINTMTFGYVFPEEEQAKESEDNQPSRIVAPQP